MPRRVIKTQATKAKRKAERAKLGKLRDARITKNTYWRYYGAVQRFTVYCEQRFGRFGASFEEIDSMLCEYIETCWQEGDHCSEVGDTISGLQHFLNRRRVFTGAWRLFDTWKTRETPTRVPPLPSAAFFGLVGLFLYWGRIDLAAIVAAGFHGLLRTTELLSIRVCHIVWGARGATLLLPNTKSGQRRGVTESVVLEDHTVLVLLSLACRGKQPFELLWTGGEPDFRRVWKLACDTIGLPENVYTPYCLRRGGATFDWLCYRNLPRTCLRGRWSHMETSRLYIVEGEELITSAQLSAECLAKSHWLAALVKNVIEYTSKAR